MATPANTWRLNNRIALRCFSSYALNPLHKTRPPQPTGTISSCFSSISPHCLQNLQIFRRERRSLHCFDRAVWCGRPSLGVSWESSGSRKMLSNSAGTADREAMERQFEEFRHQLDESGTIRERLRVIVSDLDTVTRLMHANLLLVHHSLPTPGLCQMSSELPRYVVNQVTAGDYDCPRRVSRFLSDLYAAFRILNLRNDLLRKKFDGMKYDLKKVEEVLYDVKIRGLLSDSPQLQSTIETDRDTS